MNIIQSCWSCNQKDFLKFSAGWYAPEYHLMGWALSCLQLKKYYSSVTLYADQLSSSVLIDELKLPYTDVVCNLDDLNEYHRELWALPKIYVYAQQKQSFLHVDGDVFIWKPFSEELLNGELIAQNIEAATVYYSRILNNLNSKLSYFPAEILAERGQGKTIFAYNAGIFGGHDIDFFATYTEKAKSFIDKNKHQLSEVDVNTFNIFFEQYLFYLLVQEKGKKVNVLITEIIGDNGYKGLADFIEVPYHKHFIHLLGRYKKNKIICEQMANRLRLDFPEYYYRIIALFKNKGLELRKNYYGLFPANEKSLLLRMNLLLNDYKNEKISCHNRTNERKIVFQPFRSAMVINMINEIKQKNTALPANQYEEHSFDILLFEKNIKKVLTERFSTISSDYLYARDLMHTSFFQNVFENEGSVITKELMADGQFQIIENHFDWSELHIEDIAKFKLSMQLSRKPGKFYTAIIPECDVDGYSLLNIDELDIMILNILKKPSTINNLLAAIKPAFDEEDLKDYTQDFELLMIGRIKKALHAKLIKLRNDAPKTLKHEPITSQEVNGNH